MKKSFLKDMTNGKLKEALDISRKMQDQSLIQCLKRLNLMHKEGYYLQDGVTTIYTDFAPLSFGFSRYNNDNKFNMNGGIIFHGKHDGFGSGNGPTFSVCLTPTQGWSIHT